MKFLEKGKSCGEGKTEVKSSLRLMRINLVGLFYDKELNLISNLCNNSEESLSC